MRRTLPSSAKNQPSLEEQTRIAEFRGDVINYSHMGGLNRFQEEAVRYYVKKPWVYDLGAGLLGWSKKLVEFGATTVTAVDSIYSYRGNNELNQRRDWHKCVPNNVVLDARSFRDFHHTGPTDLGTVFISWPCNTFSKTMGLEMLARKAETIIYLGKSTDGTACGSPQLWAHLTERKVLCYLPAVRNSLIVYGPEVRRKRDWLTDEHAALSEVTVVPSPKEWPLL